MLALKNRPLIGKRPQFDILNERRKAAIAGRGSVALVSGEAGSGKTRLLEEFATTLAQNRTLHIGAARVSEGQKSALRAAVEARSKRSTVVLVEDAHAAQRDVLEMLVDAGERAEGSRLLIVISYRRAELERDRDALVALGKVARLPSCVHIEIQPLDRIEMRAFVRSLLDEGVTLPPQTMERIMRLSGGNPLFLAHLVMHAVYHPSGPDATDELPLAVRATVTEWLTPLSHDDRAMLSYAALMRGWFHAADVSAIAGCAIEEVAQSLRRASDLGLLAERREQGAGYTFRHGIVAETLERHFLPHEAQALHGTIARTITSSKQAELRSAELAEHWREAGDYENASKCARHAGDRAYALAEYRDAAYWYERAVTIARNAAIPVHDLYEKLAYALERCGHALESHEALTAAAVATEATGEVVRAARLRIADAMGAQLQCDVSAGMDRVRSAVRNGLTDASQRYAQAVSASLLALCHDTEGALELLADFPPEDQAVDAAAVSKYWEVIGYIGLQRGDPIVTRDAYLRVHAAAQRSGDPALLTEAEANLALHDLAFAQPSCAERMARAIAMAQEHALPALEAYIRGYAAIDDYVRGRFTSAREHVRAIIALGPETPAAMVVRTYAGLSTARALCDEGLLAQCARPDLLELAFRSGSPSFFGRTAGPYAQWLVDKGRVAEAQALLHRCVDALRNIYGSFLTMPVVAMHAEAADVTVARAMLTAAAANPHNRVAGATLALFDALWERRDGRQRASSEAAAHAAKRYGELGWTGMRAFALELSGDLDGALGLYKLCGNLRELRRLELMPDVASKPAVEVMLSPREREIATLVAQGKSNRGIAADLSMSEKTVEAHLTAIFEKLGFRSRTELAASTAVHRIAR